MDDISSGAHVTITQDTWGKLCGECVRHLVHINYCGTTSTPPHSLSELMLERCHEVHGFDFLGHSGTAIDAIVRNTDKFMIMLLKYG